MEIQKPLKAVININLAGDNIIVAAPAAGSKIKIRLVKILFVCTAAVAIILKSGATSLTGAMSFAANAGLVFEGDFNPLDMIQEEAFIINLGGAVQVSGFILYHLE